MLNYELLLRRILILTSELIEAYSTQIYISSKKLSSKNKVRMCLFMNYYIEFHESIGKNNFQRLHRSPCSIP